MDQSDIVLEVRKGSKIFPGTLAIDNVDLKVCKGEVHAIVGENGAGKSTLMKMLAGVYNDYKGQIYLYGKEVDLHSPSIAKGKGIGMIYQELSLAMSLSIAENVLAGRLPLKHRFFIDKKTVLSKTEAALKEVGLHLNPLTLVEEISQHEAQLVELAKVLVNNPSIIVMDEPTSALSREEVERLFNIIIKLKNKGLAIIYISHILSEVFRVADRVTVLRDGKKVATTDIGNVTPDKLVKMMVGRAITDLYTEHKKTPNDVKLRVENLSRYGFFHDISFCVKKGEILGIYGFSGAGRSELARSICGIDPIDEGKIYFNRERIYPKNMKKSLEYGLAYLPEDRKTQGLFLNLSVGENILSSLLQIRGNNHKYSKKRMQGLLKNLIKRLKIIPPLPSAPINSLSGGNQQKVLLAKWLALSPQVLILDEPTRGVDINSKVDIHRNISKLADQGNAIILITSDLPELCGLSDRVIVMSQGHFIREVPKEECVEDRVLLIASQGRFL